MSSTDPHWFRTRASDDDVVHDGELGLWLCDAHVAIDFSTNLSASELRRVEQLASPTDRRSFATAHALMSYAVRSQCPDLHVIQRCAWCGGEHGQPHVLGAGDRTGWHVSLSRSHSLCAVALARTRIGVDVERWDDASCASFAVVLTAREGAAIASCRRGRRGDLAARLWCIKEALGKAMGVGLEGAEACDLLDVALYADTRPESWAGWREWSLITFKVGAQYVGALAIEGDPLELRIRDGSTACGP